MRGLFTAGILDVFMKNGIVFDGVIGVSAGAVFGCNYKSHQIGRVLRYNTRFARYPEYCSLRSLITTGDLYGKQFCYVDVPERLEPFDTETFIRDPSSFWAVATDCETGEAEYRDLRHLRNEEMDFMQASASMPVASTPVEIEGRHFLDGGISDPIPLKAFEERGYERNVVVLTQPEDYVKKPQKMMGLMSAALRKYPKVAEVMRIRHDIYNQEREYVRERAAENMPIGRISHEPRDMRRVYDIGYAEGLKHLEAVREFLKGNE